MNRMMTCSYYQIFKNQQYLIIFDNDLNKNEFIQTWLKCLLALTLILCFLYILNRLWRYITKTKYLAIINIILICMKFYTEFKTRLINLRLSNQSLLKEIQAQEKLLLWENVSSIYHFALNLKREQKK